MNASQPMSGRIAVVTGATGGIGKATAAGLAALGARVGIVGRSPDRLAATAAELGGLAGSGPIDVFAADLSSQEQVRRLAAELEERYPRIDALVNNVGGFWAHRHVTADGLELTFALNHLAPFLLTGLLIDRMRAHGDARVVAVASSAESLGRIDFDDLQGTQRYSGQRAYNQAKLADLLFTFELARRLRGTTVTANAVHPGVTRTAFGAEDQARLYASMGGLARPFMRSPERGADTVVWAASSPELDGTSGQYFHDRRAKRPSPRAIDETAAKRLWRVSEELVGLTW
ncbi:NAD(P)-dependent dehydrogenase (short-subunit alcohol dehydrogenase family) [Agromyces sp. 3263]|uniref:SDR family oxidoreductase n=1 Tax=Agromyces sp. 3263 TaxID=2817750 RepID=UPI002858CEFD|nr:SDR family oxidoreductase [Agromyces sp. 3263]MDR6905758.1 NAD(P)-dependent dehydrogenase (short-subunit alcohol dehydrogenase family) [Agromyces sp. 3263]